MSIDIYDTWNNLRLSTYKGVMQYICLEIIAV